jgi:hypothetical protein
MTDNGIFIHVGPIFLSNVYMDMHSSIQHKYFLLAFQLSPSDSRVTSE